MTASRLNEILSRFGDLTIAVVGDFFLDKYLEIDPALTEISLETGLEARQVVRVRCQPGAAGTVVSNLCALGIGRVVCIGFTGDDGEGYELRRGLTAMGADTEHVIVRPDRFTPTYCKPVVREQGRVRELERLDTKNRAPLPADVEADLISRLHAVAPQADGVIALDQVQEAECGAITTGLREALTEVASRRGLIVLGDSRTRVGGYRGMAVKSNREEACRAAHPDSPPHEARDARDCARALARVVGRPAFVTIGADGILCATADSVQHVAAPLVTGDIDAVGAGDSVTAGLVSALCAGADPAEAALIGNLCASVTIRQIGTTGTATREQVREARAGHERHPEGGAVLTEGSW
jgi:rfaE bifunctional protein kinase chain/domain